MCTQIYTDIQAHTDYTYSHTQGTPPPHTHTQTSRTTSTHTSKEPQVNGEVPAYCPRWGVGEWEGGQGAEKGEAKQDFQEVISLCSHPKSLAFSS